MQKYKNTVNPANLNGINGYLLLKINSSYVEMMSKFGLSVSDVRYLPMYEEYLRMRAEGLKVTHIISHLAEKYFLSESTVKRVVRRLSQRVIM